MQQHEEPDDYMEIQRQMKAGNAGNKKQNKMEQMDTQ